MEIAFWVLHFLALLSGIFFKVSFCCFYDKTIAYLSSGYACILDIVCLKCEIYPWSLGSGWTTSIPTLGMIKITSHHHGGLIASNRFLTWRILPNYYRRLIFDMERFWQLVWANLMSHKFFLFFFLFLCTFFKPIVCLKIKFSRVVSVLGICWNGTK